MSEPDLFRKAALDRLASPEQLDQLLHVTSPRAWLALLALAMLLAVLAGWGVLGRITTRVQGDGILLGGEVYDVVPVWSGRIAALHVEVGEEIPAGALIADIEQPELEQQIGNAEARLRDLETEDRYVRETGEREMRTHQAYYDARRASLERSIGEQQDLLALVTSQLEAQRQLLAQGLIAQETLIPVQQTHAETRAELAGVQAELTQVELGRLNADFVVRRRVLESERAVHDAQRELARLRNDHDLRSRLYGRYAGRVLEITADEGSVIPPGAPLMRLALADAGGGRVHAVLYVGADEGKRVEPGMRALVAPTTVKPEEHGYIVGEVERVAEFPATSQGMLRALNNDQLVQQLSAGGLLFEIEVALDRDSAAPSGYRWTSGRGPAVTIANGTPGHGQILVETRRPVELVIPGLRRTLSLY